MNTEINELVSSLNQEINYRGKPGTFLWVEIPPDYRTKVFAKLTTYALRNGKAKLSFESVNGFTAREGKPVYLTKITLVEKGLPAGKRGRKPKKPVKELFPGTLNQLNELCNVAHTD